MIRLFIALEIPQDTKKQITEIIDSLKAKGGNVKWVSSYNLHLTLKFLGNTEQSMVGDIENTLANAIKVDKPIASSLIKLGGFPNLKSPKVIWVDIDKNREQIIQLAKTIDLSLSEIGFDKENKAFKPHLTLGRVKDTKDINKLSEFLQQLKIEPIDCSFDSLSLIKSTLTQKGPIYKTLYKLKFSERFGD